ncbi:hypothetical protein JTB14_005320 [Gonioctena quinquepunctata]|nr:hypothetical protein JTB14_005320 [Gonioctena quinquepunctata]
MPTESKEKEKVILIHFSNYSEKFNLFDVYQFGFRKESTLDAVNRSANNILKAFENKQSCLNIFTDLSKAFNCVCHKKHLEKLYCPTDILGELQVCYVCFLVGHSLEAFEHWKKLLSLFCSCETAITKYRKLYDLFLLIVEIHLEEIPEEFLADIVSNNNFVYMKLRQLFRAIQDSEVDGQLKTKVDRLKKRLTEKHFWDFQHLDSEEEDEAPVVIET